MASQPQHPPKKAMTVKFARKTSSGRYVSLSREDMDHMPPIPDNQPMDDGVAMVVFKDNERLESGPPFGGIPRPNQMNKMVEPDASQTQMVGEARSSPCAMLGCNGAVMQDGHGHDIHPSVIPQLRNLSLLCISYSSCLRQSKPSNENFGRLNSILLSLRKH